MIFSNCSPRQMVKYVKGRTHCEIFLSECFMKYYFNVSLTVCLNIKFQLNCFFKLLWNILRQGYTMKFFFQRILKKYGFRGISWNVKFVSKFHCVCFPSIRNCVFREKISSDSNNLITLILIKNIYKKN